jgi:hypothetical protein
MKGVGDKRFSETSHIRAIPPQRFLECKACS